jgi:hypothetical protein
MGGGCHSGGASHRWTDFILGQELAGQEGQYASGGTGYNLFPMWRRYKKSHWYYRGATPASRRTRRTPWRELAGRARATLISHWRWTVVALALIIAGITLSYMGNPAPSDTASQLAVRTDPPTTLTGPFNPGPTTKPPSLGAIPPATTTTTKPGAPPNPFDLPRPSGLPFTGVTPGKAPAATPATKAPTSAPKPTTTTTTTAAKPHPTTTTIRPAPTTTTTTQAPPPPTTTAPTDPTTTTTTQATDPPTTTTTQATDPPTTTTTFSIQLPPLPILT